MLKLFLVLILIYFGLKFFNDSFYYSKLNGLPQQKRDPDLPTISVNYQDDHPLIHRTQDKEDTDLDKIITLSARLKRETVKLNSYNEQTFPMLASIKISALLSAHRAPIDLVCVIDRSGSMHGEKIRLVKSSLIQLLEFMREQDRISIVIFDHLAERIIPLIQTSEENKARIKASISIIEDQGGTDLSLGMTHALEILKQRSYSNPVTSIFLLSDGYDVKADTMVPLILKKYDIKSQFSINTFGFGYDSDPKLMTRIADMKDGNFYFIDNLRKVDEALADCLGGLLSLVAKEVTLKVKPEQSEILNGVTIASAYGNENMWKEENGEYILRTLDLMSGKQKDFILLLKLPITKKDNQSQRDKVKIESAEAIFTGFYGQKTAKKTDLFISVVNENGDYQDVEDDAEVMKNFYRVKSALAMQEAQKLADRERYFEAEKTLEACKEEMENSFLKDDEDVKNLVMNVKKAIQDVQPRTYKSSGYHYISGNSRAQMQQRSSLTSPYSNQNEQQAFLTKQVETSRSSYGSSSGSRYGYY